MKCPTCHREQKRSNPQNRRYWELVHLLSEQLKPNGQQFSPDSWHLYLKGRFLGMTEVELPSGQVLTRTVSSAGLGVSEFAEYMTQVEAWGAEQGIYLPDMAEAEAA